MEKEPNLKLREKYLYGVSFGPLEHNSDSDDDYYDEIVYYDGGGVEGYGETKTN